jgi:DNA-binding ferritin-like protein
MAEDPGAIREAIEETREEMAETIQALGQKADVKARANEKVDDIKASAGEVLHKVDQKIPEQARPALNAVAPKAEAGVAKARENPKALAIAGGALLVVMILRRRRSRRRAA